MAREDNQKLVVDYAAACGVDPTIAFYQINRESQFNERAVGSSGERGLAQFTPGTWARFGQGPFGNAFIPSYAMDAYCAYMGYLLGLFGGDYSKALTGYNGGEGHLTDPAKHGPPSAAARSYASQILAQAGAGGASLPSGPSAIGGASTILIAGALLGLVAIFLARD